MYRIHQVKLGLNENKEMIPRKILKMIGREDLVVKEWTIVRESLDARKKSDIHWVCSVDFSLSPEERLKKGKFKCKVDKADPFVYTLPIADKEAEKTKDRPVIVGFGPAGMFAGLILAQAGYKPLILERGSDVDTRTGQVKEFWEKGILDENSNVQFGEGGAGTFSDGKLTTGIKDIRIRKVLEEMVAAGAPEDILYKQKPHVGTDILRGVVKNIRNTITELGGEIYFNCLVKGICIDEDKVSGLVVSNLTNSEKSDLVISCQSAVFAIGHSSRDTFRWMKDDGIVMNQKPFSMGVRIEHPQDLIDISQYGAPGRELGLPVSDYKISYRCDNGRGVYSFCMCPGGKVIVASSQKGGVTTNGMSYHHRDSGTANSALLCDVRTEDFGSDEVLAGVDFQEKYERLAFINGGGDYSPPKTTWGKLRDGKAPNVENSLPEFVVKAFREAMPALGRKIAGFDNDDAVITGIEARSSCPVRFARNEEYQGAIWLKSGKKNVNLRGFYPCGEGAGYAGGIMSAAVDGIRVAESIIKNTAKI